MFNKNKNIVLYSKKISNKKSSTKQWFGPLSTFSGKSFFFFTKNKNLTNPIISFCFSKNNTKNGRVTPLKRNFPSPLQLSRYNKKSHPEILYLSRKDPFFYEKRAVIVLLVQSSSFPFFLEDGYQINFGGFAFLQRNFALHLEKKDFSKFDNSLSEFGSIQKTAPEVFLSQSIFRFLLKAVFYRKFCYFLSFRFLTNNPIISSLDLIFFQKSLKSNIVDEKQNLFIYSKSISISRLVNQPFFLRSEETKNLVNKSGYQFSNKIINLYSPLPVASVYFSKVSKHLYFLKPTPFFLDIVKTSSETSELRLKKYEKKRIEQTYLFSSGTDFQKTKKENEIVFISEILTRKSRPINFESFPLKTETSDHKNNKFSYFYFKNLKINDLANNPLLGNRVDKKKFFRKVDSLSEREILNLQIFPKFYKTKTAGFVLLKNPLSSVLTVNNFSHSSLKDGTVFSELEEEGYINSSFANSSDSFIGTHLEQTQIFFIPEEVYDCTQFNFLVKLGKLSSAKRNLAQKNRFLNKNKVFSKKKELEFLLINSPLLNKKRTSQNKITISTKFYLTTSTLSRSQLLKSILSLKWSKKKKPLFYKFNRQGKKIPFYSPFEGLLKIYSKKNQSFLFLPSKEKRLKSLNLQFVPFFSVFCSQKKKDLLVKKELYLSKLKILTTLQFFQLIEGGLESSNWFSPQNVGFSSFLEQKKFESNLLIKPFPKDKTFDKSLLKSTLIQKKVLIPKKMNYVITFTSKKYRNKFSIPFSFMQNFVENFYILNQNKKTFGRKKHVLSQKFCLLVKNYKKICLV
uniref:Beta'' subunit of RNA polymerase n=1 Tax=Pleurastrosarcina brevispinosa TaxID=163096 RepID=A0A097KN73_9CHLO|nr:beta'' subunit of RNA polymerase [Chlorosarcina brevispinosa]